MNDKMLLAICCMISSSLLQAQSLELRPLLKDRFEHNCAIRQQYDFHDENTDLTAPLNTQVIDSKYEEEQAYDLNRYQLKNVVYAGIPIQKIEFGFGRPAQQYNEYLYFDLSKASAKKAFKLLKFKQNHKHAAVSVEYNHKKAVVHCYWLRQD